MNCAHAAYGDLGNAHNRLGDFHRAIQYHERDLQIAIEEGGKARERRANRNLGNAYKSLGNFHKEIQYLKSGLKISNEVGDKAGEGRTYENRGNAHNSLSGFFIRQSSTMSLTYKSQKEWGTKYRKEKFMEILAMPIRA